MKPFILIVDDDAPYARELRSILAEETSAEVQVCETGEAGLAVLLHRPEPTVLVLDMMVPFDEADHEGGMPPAAGEEARGMKVLRELQRSGFDLGLVVVITALPNLEDLVPITKIGIGEGRILTKPARTLQIIGVVRQALGRARMQG